MAFRTSYSLKEPPETSTPVSRTSLETASERDSDEEECEEADGGEDSPLLFSFLDIAIVHCVSMLETRPRMEARPKMEPVAERRQQRESLFASVCFCLGRAVAGVRQGGFYHQKSQKFEKELRYSVTVYICQKIEN